MNKPQGSGPTNDDLPDDGSVRHEPAPGEKATDQEWTGEFELSGLLEYCTKEESVFGDLRRLKKAMDEGRWDPDKAEEGEVPITREKFLAMYERLKQKLEVRYKRKLD